MSKQPRRNNKRGRSAPESDEEEEEQHWQKVCPVDIMQGKIAALESEVAELAGQCSAWREALAKARAQEAEHLDSIKRLSRNQAATGADRRRFSVGTTVNRAPLPCGESLEQRSALCKLGQNSRNGDRRLDAVAVRVSDSTLPAARGAAAVQLSPLRASPVSAATGDDLRDASSTQPVVDIDSTREAGAGVHTSPATPRFCEPHGHMPAALQALACAGANASTALATAEPLLLVAATTMACGGPPLSFHADGQPPQQFPVLANAASRTSSSLQPRTSGSGHQTHADAAAATFPLPPSSLLPRPRPLAEERLPLQHLQHHHYHNEQQALLSTWETCNEQAGMTPPPAEQEQEWLGRSGIINGRSGSVGAVGGVYAAAGPPFSPLVPPPLERIRSISCNNSVGGPTPHYSVAQPPPAFILATSAATSASSICTVSAAAGYDCGGGIFDSPFAPLVAVVPPPMAALSGDAAPSGGAAAAAAAAAAAPADVRDLYEAWRSSPDELEGPAAAAAAAAGGGSGGGEGGVGACCWPRLWPQQQPPIAGGRMMSSSILNSPGGSNACLQLQQPQPLPQPRPQPRLSCGTSWHQDDGGVMTTRPIGQDVIAAAVAAAAAAELRRRALAGRGGGGVVGGGGTRARTLLLMPGGLQGHQPQQQQQQQQQCLQAQAQQDAIPVVPAMAPAWHPQQQQGQQQMQLPLPLPPPLTHAASNASSSAFLCAGGGGAGGSSTAAAAGVVRAPISCASSYVCAPADASVPMSPALTALKTSLMGTAFALPS